MGARSRRKGKSGELEWVHLLREHGLVASLLPPATAGEEAPDVTHEHFSAEVKRRKAFIPKRLWDALNQARASEGIPYVAARNDHDKEWGVFMSAEDFFKLAFAYHAIARADDLINTWRVLKDIDSGHATVYSNNPEKYFKVVTPWYVLTVVKHDGEYPYVIVDDIYTGIRKQGFFGDESVTYHDLRLDLEEAFNFQMAKLNGELEGVKVPKGGYIAVYGWLIGGKRYTGPAINITWERRGEGNYVAVGSVGNEDYAVSDAGPNPMDAIRALVSKVIERHPEWAKEVKAHEPFEG